MPIAAMDKFEQFYELAGPVDAPVVLLIPGLGATTASFAMIAGTLAEGRRVLSVDLRGVGKSSPGVGPYTMKAWASDLTALLDYLGIDRVHALGASLGGCVAQVLAVTAPDRVRSLCLLSSFSEIDRTLELNYRTRIALVERFGLEQPPMPDYLRTTLFGRTFLDSPLGEAVSHLATRMLGANDPAVYVKHLGALLQFGDCDRPVATRRAFTASLAAVRAPTLVMCGTEDTLTVPTMSERMAAAITNAELVRLERCGHAIQTERPDHVAGHLMSFWQRVETPLTPAQKGEC